MLTQTPNPGHIVLVHGADGSVHGTADMQVGRAGQRIEVDLARVRKRNSGSVEYQFVQLGPNSETSAAYSLQVRVEPTIIMGRLNDARWKSFVEECVSAGPGRSPDEVKTAFDSLTYDKAQSMTVRALTERTTRLGSLATVTFATIDGGDIARIIAGDGAEVQVPLEAVVEVTMELSTLSELIGSIGEFIRRAR